MKTTKPARKTAPQRFELQIGKKFTLRFSRRNLILWLLAFFVILSIFGSFKNNPESLQEKPLTAILTDIKAGNVEKVNVEDSRLTVFYKNGDKFLSFKEDQDSFRKILSDAGVDSEALQVKIVDTAASAAIASFLANLLPTLLFIGFFIFMLRQARGAQDSIFAFGNSKAKMFSKKMPRVTFKDVAGIDEAREEMEELVDFLKHPQKYQKVGARTPKGVLLVGPAGTGKTLLARALAGEANIPFYSMAGSEFMEMLVGVGAKRVRDLFDKAKQSQPSVIFIDEIDAIGRRRTIGVVGGHDEREQTLNQILVEMDGFDPRTSVLVVAATNRGDLLDPALLRPGRFDRRVILDFPDIEGRKGILKIHAQGKPFDASVKWDQVAKRTVGFSGADLENMLNEAAILAARENKDKITSVHIEEAATKVKLGPEKKRLKSDLDKKMTAYHEAGHAVVSYFLESTDPVHRISIVSRGLALGYTLIPPEKDRLHETKTHIIEQIAVMMGGRVAEEFIFNEITSGAANDFDQATRLARLMVEEYGMSALGPVNFGPDMDITDMGRYWYDNKQISPGMQERIDNEVKRFLDEGYAKAQTILKKNKKKLDLIALELVKKETLEAEDFEKLMK